MRFFNRKTKITDREFDAVARELSLRVKDMVYMNCENKIREKLGAFRDTLLTRPSTDGLQTSYTVDMVFGDVQQIIGRIRMRKHRRK